MSHKAKYVSTRSGYYVLNAGTETQVIAQDGTMVGSLSAAHAMLSSTHSDATAAAVARGAIITGQGSTPAWVRLTIGTTGYVLRSDGTDCAWGQIANAGVASDAAIAYSKLAAMSSNYILAGVSNLPVVCSVAGDLTMSTATTVATFAIASGVIVNDDVNATAGITVGKIALTTGSVMLGASSVGSALDAKGDGKIMVGNSTTVTSVSVSGDCTLSNSGAMTVVDLTITSEAAGDILYRNATNWVRLAKPGSSGYFLEGGTTPQWSLPALGSASAIVSGAELSDGGVLDATITFTQQTIAAPSVVIPNFAGAGAKTFGFLEFAQTWSANQKFNYGNLLLGDSDNVQTLQILVNENMTGDKTLTIQPNNANRVIHLHGDIDIAANFTTTVGTVALAADAGTSSSVTLPATGTLATLTGTETLSGKTLTAPKIVTTGHIDDDGGAPYLTFIESTTPLNAITITQGDTTVMPRLQASGETNIGLKITGKGTGKVTIADAATITKMLNFELVGATATKTMTITSSHTNDCVLTLPDATDTLVGKATTDAFTNKSFNCDGTGNALTNVNATELDPITDGAFGIPFIYTKVLNADGGDLTVVENSVFKFRILDAWSIETTAGAGIWSLKTDGGKATDDVSCANNVNDIDRITQIVPAYKEVAATTGDLFITNDTFKGIVYILCMRID